jgi:antitoxin HicB
MFAYQALFEPAPEGGFVVTFPDLNHGATQGETEAEARDMAVDFLATVVAHYIEAGEKLPDPKRYPGKKYRTIELPARETAKAEFYRAFCEAGIRKAELARRLGISKGNVERLFDLKHSTRIELLEEAFHAVGKRLSIEIHKVAAA